AGSRIRSTAARVKQSRCPAGSRPAGWFGGSRLQVPCRVLSRRETPLLGNKTDVVEERIHVRDANTRRPRLAFHIGTQLNKPSATLAFFAIGNIQWLGKIANHKKASLFVDFDGFAF